MKGEPRTIFYGILADESGSIPFTAWHDFNIEKGDVVEIREKSRKIQAIADALDAVVRRGVPQWLELEKDNMKGIVNTFPEREDITMPMQEQLIVELYSK